MTFFSTYIYGFVSEIMKTSYYHQEIEYSRPDESLYDSDSCPCCREKFGVTEYCEEIKPEFIAPRSNKKRMKKWTVVKDKRHTHCGHPVCLECFNAICGRDKPSCPQCRRSYEETGDMRIYYKTKFGLNAEDMKKYDTLLPLVAKITRHLEELQEQKPELIPDVLQPFLVPRY